MAVSIPTYIPRDRKWHFSHQHNEGFQLFAMGPEEQVVRRSMVLDGPDALMRSNKNRWQRCLMTDVPEMAPAMEWVENYISESRLLAADVKVFDPTIGHLLAFGTAIGHRSRTINVAAYARGDVGSDLVLAEMKVEDRSFTASDGVTLTVPRLVHSAYGPQCSSLSPIRQICFAGNPYKEDAVNPVLAVRTAGYTKVFKVLYRHTQGHQVPNRLGLQPMVTANTLGSGGHSDVAFNPWYSRQFGTVDQKGNWGVWDIEGAYERSRKGFGLTLKYTTNGRVTCGDHKTDGWGQIKWGGDLNTVVACDRHTASLFDIRTSVTSPNTVLPVGPRRSWILDMQRSPTNGSTHDAYILTSSDVAWVDIRQPGRTLLSWPHRRHPDDASMYLELLRSSNVTTALVGSRLNFLTTAYQFSPGTGMNYSPAMLGDSFMLSPPFNRSNTAINIAFVPCPLRTARGATGPAAGYEDSGAKFFTGFAIDKEMRISQRLYGTQEISKPPVSGATVSSEYIAESEEEEADMDSEAAGAFAGSRGHSSESGGPRSHRWTNLSKLYDAIFRQGDEALRTVQDGDTANSAAGYCAALAELLETRAERGNLGIGSLIDVRTPSLVFDKLSDLEAGIDELLSSLKIKDLVEIHSLTHGPLPDPLMATGDPSRISVQTLYDNLVNTRVASLPANIPPRIRLHRERLSRLVAVELYLASIGISIKPTPEQLLPPPSQAFNSHGLSQVSSPPGHNGEDGENEHLQRIREYAYVQTRITLPVGIGRVLNGWKVGENPENCEFWIGREEGVPRFRRDRREVRKEKKRLSHRGCEAASQGNDGMLGVFGGRQPLLLNDRLVGSQVPMSQAPDSQSQAQSQAQTVTMSQVVQGKHGGRMQKKRKTGF